MRSAVILATELFAISRRVYAFYDPESDPSELKNISGSPEYTDIERELRTALAEKMILDFDYLPLPNLMDTEAPAARKQGNAKRKANQ